MSEGSEVLFLLVLLFIANYLGHIAKALNKANEISRKR